MTLIYEGAISSRAVGGARLHFRGLARAIERSGVEDFRVVLPRFSDEPAYDPGVASPTRVSRVPTLGRSLKGHVVYEILKSGLVAGCRLSDMLRRRRTVHMMRISPIGISPLFSRALGAIVVVEVNGLPDSEFESRGFHDVVVRLVRATTTLQLRAATHVVAVTDGLAAAARQRTTARVLRIENAVDLDDLGEMIERSGSGAARTITYSGAFAPWQELELLVRAFARLVERDPESPWRLILIGDGEDRESIERAIVECGVTDLVEITGWVDRNTAAERVLGGRVAVVPLTPKSSSGICGSPLKLFEYLALDRRVVGSDVDGVVELHDYPVIVYEHGNVDALVAALESAVAVEAVPEHNVEWKRRLSWDDRWTRIAAFLEI